MGTQTPRPGIRRRSVALAALVVAVAVVASVWAGSASSSSAAGATVQTRNIKGLGTVLVNSRGLTLYMFVPDKQKKATCKGACAVLWPPLKLKTGQKPTAGGAARKALLGTDPYAGGKRIVTYAHWPLYTYYLDKKPGQATGQAVNNSGGLWYVLAPSGKIIKKKP
jgi:predicted lipoprotein with Yx(FWY)xxD motif